MDSWSVEMVETRLEDAAYVIRRLPAVRMPGYFNTWPAMLIEFADRVGRHPEPMRLPPPSVECNHADGGSTRVATLARRRRRQVGLG